MSKIYLEKLNKKTYAYFTSQSIGQNVRQISGKYPVIEAIEEKMNAKIKAGVGSNAENCIDANHCEEQCKIADDA
jgi:hypothetical protein